MPHFESFYYETKGDKNNPAVVFLHGFLGSAKSWNEIVSLAENEFYCVTIDLPGHGQTMPADEESYAFEMCAEKIIGITNSLGIKKFNLVGYSMGGRLALYIALNYSDRINKLILESSSPGLKSESERETRREADYALVEKLEQTQLAEFLGDWYNQPLFQSLKRNEFKFSSMLNERKNNDPAGLARSLRFMGTGVQATLWEKLSQIKPETLLIVGELDRKFQEIAGQMSIHSKYIKIEKVRDCGHNVHFEKPDEYAAVIKKFLK